MTSSCFLTWNRATLRSQKTDGQQGWNRILDWNSLWLTLSPLTRETCLFPLAEGQPWELKAPRVASLSTYVLDLPSSPRSEFCRHGNIVQFPLAEHLAFCPKSMLKKKIKSNQKFHVNLLFLATSLLPKGADKREKKGSLISRWFYFGKWGCNGTYALGPGVLMTGVPRAFLHDFRIRSWYLLDGPMEP